MLTLLALIGFYALSTLLTAVLVGILDRLDNDKTNSDQLVGIALFGPVTFFIFSTLLLIRLCVVAMSKVENKITISNVWYWIYSKVRG